MLFLSECIVKLTMTKQNWPLIGVVLESIFAGVLRWRRWGWASILGQMVHMTIFTQDLGSSARSSSLLLPSIEGHSFHKSENLSGVLSHYGSSKAKIIIDPFPPPNSTYEYGHETCLITLRDAICYTIWEVAQKRGARDAVLKFVANWWAKGPKYGGPSECFWPGILLVGHRKSTELSWTGYDKIYLCFSIFSGDASWDPSNLSCFVFIVPPCPPPNYDKLEFRSLTMTILPMPMKKCLSKCGWIMIFHQLPNTWNLPKIERFWEDFPSLHHVLEENPSILQFNAKHPGVLKHGWSYKLGQAGWKPIEQKDGIKNHITSVSYQLPFLNRFELISQITPWPHVSVYILYT